MKKLRRSILLFSRARANRHESRNQRPEWDLFQFSWLSGGKYSEFLTIFSIQVLTASLFFLMAHTFNAATACGQEIPDTIALPEHTEDRVSISNGNSLPSWVDSSLAEKTVSSPAINKELHPNQGTDSEKTQETEVHRLPEELPIKELPACLDTVPAPPAVPMPAAPASGNALILSKTNAAEENSDRTEDPSLDAIPESIMQAPERDPQNTVPKDENAEHAATPEHTADSPEHAVISQMSAEAIGQELPKRELKTWEGTGLIPQNWEDESMQNERVFQNLSFHGSDASSEITSISENAGKQDVSIQDPLSAPLPHELPDELPDELPNELPEQLPNTFPGDDIGSEMGQNAVSETAAALPAAKDADLGNELPSPPVLAEGNEAAIDTDLTVPDSSLLISEKGSADEAPAVSQIADRTENHERNSKLDEELSSDLAIPESLKDGASAVPSQVAEIDTDLSVPSTFELSPKSNSEPEDETKLQAAEIAAQMGSDVPVQQTVSSQNDLCEQTIKTAAQKKEERLHLEKSFDSAIAAIEKPAASLGKFHSMCCVSRAVLEENWGNELQSGKIQTVSHEEPAHNGKPAPVLAVNGEKAQADPEVKRLNGPKRVRRLEKAPVRKVRNAETASETRFDLEISPVSIEEMISTGTRVPQNKKMTENSLVVRASEELQTEGRIVAEEVSNGLSSQISVPQQEPVWNTAAEESDPNDSSSKNTTDSRLDLFDLGIDREKLFPKHSQIMIPQQLPEPNSSTGIPGSETPFRTPIPQSDIQAEPISSSISMSSVSHEENEEEAEISCSSVTVSYTAAKEKPEIPKSVHTETESAISGFAISGSIDTASVTAVTVRPITKGDESANAIRLIQHLAEDSQTNGNVRLQNISRSGMNAELAEEEVESDFLLTPQEELEKETVPAVPSRAVKPLDILDEAPSENGLVEELAGTILNDSSNETALKVSEEAPKETDGGLHADVVHTPENQTQELPQNMEGAQEAPQKAAPIENTEANATELILSETVPEIQITEEKEIPQGTEVLSEDELLLNFEGDEEESPEKPAKAPEKPKGSHADALGELILESPDTGIQDEFEGNGTPENEALISVKVSTNEAVQEETEKKFQAIAHDTVEKTARQTAKETAEETARNTAEKTARETVEMIARQAADDAVENAAQKLTKQTAEIVVDEIADQIADQVVERTVDEVMRRLGPQLKQESGKTLMPDPVLKNSNADLAGSAKDPDPAEISDDLFLLEDPNESIAAKESKESEPGFVKLRAPQKNEAIFRENLIQNGKKLETLQDLSVPEEPKVQDHGLTQTQVSRTLDPNARGAAPEVRVLDPNARDAVPNVRVQDPNARIFASDESTPHGLQALDPDLSTASPSGSASGNTKKKEAPGFVKLSGRKRRTKNSESANTPSLVPADAQNTSSAETRKLAVTGVQTPVPTDNQVPVQRQMAPDLIPQHTSEQTVALPQTASMLMPPVSEVSEHPTSSGKTNSMNETKAPQANGPAAGSFLFADEEVEARFVTIRPCEGVVLNADSTIRRILVEDPSACDSLELSSSQLALIGKFPGQTRVRIEFVDEEIEPMLFCVEVQNGDPRSQTLASWAKFTEERINREIPDTAVSIFLFQDRVFVKGKPGETVDPQRILSAVQRDYLRMKRENPVINDSPEKTMLVDLLSAK